MKNMISKKQEQVSKTLENSNESNLSHASQKNSFEPIVKAGEIEHSRKGIV